MVSEFSARCQIEDTCPNCYKNIFLGHIDSIAIQRAATGTLFKTSLTQFAIIKTSRYPLSASQYGFTYLYDALTHQSGRL